MIGLSLLAIRILNSNSFKEKTYPTNFFFFIQSLYVKIQRKLIQTGKLESVPKRLTTFSLKAGSGSEIYKNSN